MGASGPDTLAIACCFSQAETRSEVEKPGQELPARWNAGIPGGILPATPQCRPPVLIPILFSLVNAGNIKVPVGGAELLCYSTHPILMLQFESN